MLKVTKQKNRRLYCPAIGYGITGAILLSKVRAGESIQVTCVSTQNDVTAETLLSAWFEEMKKRPILSLDEIKKIIAA